MYYCKTQTYLILLNRQRTDKPPEIPSGVSSKISSSSRPVNRTPSSHPSPTTTIKSSPRGRPQVLTSAEGVVTAFLFFYTRAPASLVSWTISQQAFNSSMILLLDALETGNFSRVRKVEQAYVIFRELQEHSIHKLATLAVEKLSWGLDQLRRNMGGYAAHQYPDKIDPVCVSKSEADPGTRTSHDTVMGNTGMLLLEEAGLQSYAPECFAPFTWAMTEAMSEPMTPYQVKKEQESQLQSRANRVADVKFGGSNQISSISIELQDTTEPIQNTALGRYCTPLSREHSEPHSCVAGLASPLSLGAPVPHQDLNDGTVVPGPYHSQQTQSLHLSYPGTRPITSAAFTRDQQQGHGMDRSIGAELPQQWSQTLSTPKQYQVSAAQLRHNSCPSLHQLATTPPLLRPTHSSPIAKQAQSPARTVRPVHAHWSATPADPSLDSLEPGIVISPMSDQGHVIPSLLHEGSQQQQLMYQYPLPTHSTAAIVGAVVTTNVEQMTVDQWKRWIESGAPE